MTTTDTPTTAGRSRAEGTTEPPEPYRVGPRLGRPRGRHRRPRPRKVLLAAGGLAVAAGVLSLVRLTPDPGVGGLGAAEAEQSPDPYSGTDAGRSTNAADVRAETPAAGPSATTAMGGPSALPTPGGSLALTPATASTQPPAPTAVVTTIPNAPNPTGTPVPAPPRPSTPATAPPAPAPTPSRATPPPAPQPDRPDRPGLCVPVIAVCLNPPTAGQG